MQKHVRFSKEASRLLWLMVWNPPALNPADPEKVQPFKAVNKSAQRSLFKLTRFVDLKLIASRPAEGMAKFHEGGWSGRIREELIDVAKEMCEHYREVLSLSFNVAAVQDLLDGLDDKDEGKTVEGECEDDPKEAPQSAQPAVGPATA